MDDNFKWFGEFPNKKSYPNRINVWSNKVGGTNCIIADTFITNSGGFTQLRLCRDGSVALIRFDSEKSEAPYPYTKAKILWDSRKHFNRAGKPRQKKGGG